MAYYIWFNQTKTDFCVNEKNLNSTIQFNIQWAVKVLRAPAKKYVFSHLNISGHRKDIVVLLTVLNSS
jgi:hypothetical protein